MSAVLRVNVSYRVASSRKDRVLGRIDSLAEIRAVVDRPHLRGSAYNQGVKPFREGTRPQVTTSPTSQACRCVVFPFVRRFAIRLFCFVDGNQVVKDDVAVYFRVGRVLGILRGTVSR